MSIKFGIQLYTLRDHCQTLEDIDETLKKLHSWGVRDVQLSAIGPVDWYKLPDILNKYDMKVCVTHTNFQRMIEETDKVIDEHLAIGCDCLGIGAMPYERNGESIDKFFSEVTTVAKKMRERGVHLAYHNHDFDLMSIDGKKPILDTMIEDIDPDLLWFIPDVAWLQIAGKNPSEYLKKMEGRVKVLHFKDYSADTEDKKHPFIELGKGLVDLKD